MSVSALVRARDAVPGIGTLLDRPHVWRGPHAHRSPLRARLDPRRAAMVAGKWAALR
jgi:hypothetical protein